MRPKATVSGYTIEMHPDPGATFRSGTWRGEFVNARGKPQGAVIYDARREALLELEPGRLGSPGFIEMARIRIRDAVLRLAAG